MKRFLFLPVFLLISLSIGAQEAYTPEEQAIIDVIENESIYFWARDYRNWKKTWVQTDYIVWTAATRDGVQQYVGWNNWSQAVIDLFSDSPDPQPFNVQKYDYNIHIYGDGAWVTFIQNTGNLSHESRILEKHDGKWRIVFVSAIYIEE